MCKQVPVVQNKLDFNYRKKLLHVIKLLLLLLETSLCCRNNFVSCNKESQCACRLSRGLHLLLNFVFPFNMPLSYNLNKL
jgi:hypothetical protein